MLCYKFDKLEREKILDALSLVIHGDFGKNDKPIKPIKTKTVCNCKFSVGEVISFHMKHMDIGDLYKLELVQNYPGQSTRWFLKSFEVRCDKNKYTFFYNKWITSSRADKKAIKIKLYEKDYKIKRTVSTMSHRLLKGYDQEEINNESLDDSDPESKSKDSKRVKRKSNMDKYDRDDDLDKDQLRERRERGRDRERDGGRDRDRDRRSRRYSDDEWDDDDAESWGSSSRSRSTKDRSLDRKDKLRLRLDRDLSDHDLRRDERDDFLKKYSKYESNRSRSPSPSSSRSPKKQLGRPFDRKRPDDRNKNYDYDSFEDNYDKLKSSSSSKSNLRNEDNFGSRFQRRTPEMPVDDKHFLGRDAVMRRDKEVDDNFKQRMRLNTISEDDERSSYRSSEWNSSASRDDTMRLRADSKTRPYF